jgi:hypothetical protein
MVTVRFSKSQEFILPESLGKTLRLRKGGRIQVEQHVDFCNPI